MVNFKKNRFFKMVSAFKNNFTIFKCMLFRTRFVTGNRQVACSSHKLKGRRKVVKPVHKFYAPLFGRRLSVAGSFPEGKRHRPDFRLQALLLKENGTALTFGFRLFY